MSVNFRRAVCAVFVAAGLIGWTTVVEAAPGGPSVAIKFAAGEPDGPPADPGDMDTSAVNGPAGVFGTPNWNNMTGPNQTTPQVLNHDINGVGSPSPLTVTWSSVGLWSSTGRGEENNTAPAGDNRDLMAGYLDTGGLGGVTGRRYRCRHSSVAGPSGIRCLRLHTRWRERPRRHLHDRRHDA